MTLYTVANIDQVLEGIDQERESIELEFGEVKLQVEPISLTQGRIVRLISTDCRHYLNSKLQPGSIINFSPQNLL